MCPLSLKVDHDSEMMAYPNLDAFRAALAGQGYYIFEGLVPPDLVERMKVDLQGAWQRCGDIQRKNLPDQDAELTVHHLVGQGESFLEYLKLSETLDPYLRDCFEGPYILNSFGGAINSPGWSSYAHRIHRDVRTFSPTFRLLLNTLVMLDDFTEENGATWLYPEGQNLSQAPDSATFYSRAKRAIAPAGSVLIFDSNLWHAGGDNHTSQPRRSVTPMYSRPFIKPQFDYPRALGYGRADEFDGYLRQVIGYNSRVPASLDEWYQPPEKRAYRRDQG